MKAKCLECGRQFVGERCEARLRSHVRIDHMSRLEMCGIHEMRDGRPDPDCELCLEGGVR